MCDDALCVFELLPFFYCSQHCPHDVPLAWSHFARRIGRDPRGSQRRHQEIALLERSHRFFTFPKSTVISKLGAVWASFLISQVSTDSASIQRSLRARGHNAHPRISHRRTSLGCHATHSRHLSFKAAARLPFAAEFAAFSYFQRLPGGQVPNGSYPGGDLAFLRGFLDRPRSWIGCASLILYLRSPRPALGRFASGSRGGGLLHSSYSYISGMSDLCREGGTPSPTIPLPPGSEQDCVPDFAAKCPS